MAEPFLTEIRLVPFNFAPTGWAQCDGQLLPINQYSAVFSLVGTSYGGDGRSNFALPNLQAMVPIGMGQGPGLTERVIGETGGSETVTLTGVQIPPHSHGMRAYNHAAITTSPVGTVPANGPKTAYAHTVMANGSPSAILPAGGTQPHNNLQPFLVMNYIIALNGVFPARA